MVKVLVVDDSEFFRKLYVAELTKAGFEVETAEDGRQAVDQMIASPPRLVFMDLVMPEMTGQEALAEIKKTESIKKVPVIMLTSISADIKGEDLLMEGAVGYLMKDTITPAEVVAKAKEVLGTSEQPLDPNAE
jgi:CheY-like chemotaxis protein